MDSLAEGVAAWLAESSRRDQDAIAHRQLPFETAEYRQRHERLRRAMAAAEIDLLLLSRPESMCWLTGYSARWYRHNGPAEWPGLATTAVRVDSDELIHFDFADERSLLAVTSVCDDVRIYPREELDWCLPFLLAELTAKGWLRGVVGRERHSPVPDQETANAVESALREHDCPVVDGGPVIDGVTHIKSSAEMALIDEAMRIADVGVRALIDAMAPGVTELELWAEMMRAMIMAGGEPSAIHEKVTSGPVRPPHAWSGRRPLQMGDMVNIDPCGVRDRYHANLARSIFLGEPPQVIVDLARRQGEAFAVFCEAAVDGALVDDVGETMRSYYKDAGIWDLRYWPGGYELGIAFPPDWVGPWLFDFTTTQPGKAFQAGMVTNIEGSFAGVAMIDTVIYERDGARLLSSIPRELLVVAP